MEAHAIELVQAIRWAVLIVVVSATSLAAPGCGADDVGPRSRIVGGRCTTDTDCVKRCVTGAEFPGGYCTVTCANSNDCPGGSACVASNAGICVATCQVAAHCEDYGPGYQCGLATNQAGGAGSRVCLGS